MALLSSETIHASAVSIGGRAVLLAGRSGAGKSDLALRLIDRGAGLISDDYTLVKRSGSDLVAEAPANIAGKIEVRGIGIVEMDAAPAAPIVLLVDLDAAAERMPPPGQTRTLLGISVPVIVIDAVAAAAPLKVELALRLYGPS